MEAPEGRIRPLVPADLPAVVALRDLSFRKSTWPTPAERASYFERVFFRNPWAPDVSPSLVFERDGRIIGFMGVIRRPMRFQEERIDMAVPTQLMVEPKSRGTIGARLLKALFAGTQDLSLSDVANEAAKRISLGLGGELSHLYSMVWSRTLRPARHAMRLFGGGKVQRAAAATTAPFAALIDAGGARLGGSPFRPAAAVGRVDPATPETAARLEAEISSGSLLRPESDSASLGWLFERLGEKPGIGTLAADLVRTEGGGAAGWFLWFRKPAGTAQVVHMAALPGAHGLVLDHLIHRAWTDGSVELRGKLDPGFMQAMAERRCTFHREGPWTLVHSRRPEILAAVHRGDALLSRLEGEWWLSF